jgi:beta-lactamase regulating signal transducer with metallopeptidase domain
MTMPAIFLYMLKLSISLGVVYIFYHFILRKLTFYNNNRWYLLLYTGICFFVPFININPVLERIQWTDSQVIEWVPVVSEKIYSGSETPGTVSSAASVSFWTLSEWLLLAGITFMLLRLLFQLFSFYRMKRRAQYISGDSIKLFRVKEQIIPFSFGNSVFINPDLHNEQELQEIIRHEFVHVRQKHTIDIVWGEIVCLLNWYNPFAWLLKSSMRQNLEFIADHKVLENGFDKKEYQYLLLKVIGNHQFSIASPFNFSSLKKRIAMMNKLKSARLNLVRFLFVLPLAAVLLLAFRQRDSNPVSVTSFVKTTTLLKDKQSQLPLQISFSDTTPVTDKEKIKKISDRFEINDKKATMHLKDGTVEEYDLANPEQRKKFEENYGKIITLDNMGTALLATTVKGVSIVANSNANTNIVSNLNSNVQVITPTLVKGVNIAVGEGNGEGNGEGIGLATTVRPLTVISGQGLTSTSPELVNGVVLFKSMISPSTISEAVTGTTVLAPLHPTMYGEGVTIVDEAGNITKGKEEVLITITRYTPRAKLDDFKKQMKEKGIDLNFFDIEYNDKGFLVNISGTMDSKDGKTNFVANDFEKLILSMVVYEDRKYFKVTVKDKEVI